MFTDLLIVPDIVLDPEINACEWFLAPLLVLINNFRKGTLTEGLPEDITFKLRSEG